MTTNLDEWCRLWHQFDPQKQNTQDYSTHAMDEIQSHWMSLPNVMGSPNSID